MTYNPSMAELLAPAVHSIHERERLAAPLSFVRRVGARKGRQPCEETPAQRKGRRYESRVGRWLTSRAVARCLKVWDHEWLEYQFQHENFIRRAQPDFVLEPPPREPSLVSPLSLSFVFEVKQTWVDTTSQLDLYVTLLANLGLNAIPVTLCKNLTPQAPKERVVRSFDKLVPYSIMMVRV